MTERDPITDLPRSSLGGLHKFGAGSFSMEQKLREWGIDPEWAQRMLDEEKQREQTAPDLCECLEEQPDGSKCDGRWRVIDDSQRIWEVKCDKCGFETGVPSQNKTVVAQRRLAKANLPDRFVGVKFVEDADNREALNVCRSWLQDFADEQRTHGKPGLPALALHGAPGVGKTHLLTALCTRLIHERETSVYFTSVRELLRDLQRFDDSVIHTDAWKRATKTTVLALDDLGAQRISDWRAEQLAELIDDRYLAEMPILLTTNYPPEKWPTILDERSYDRLLNRRMVIPVFLGGGDRRQA